MLVLLLNNNYNWLRFSKDLMASENQLLWPYFSLRYCRKELTGYERILLPIGEYLQEKIAVDVLLGMERKISAECQSANGLSSETRAYLKKRALSLIP
jgi:hypothetical protein